MANDTWVLEQIYSLQIAFLQEGFETYENCIWKTGKHTVGKRCGQDLEFAGAGNVMEGRLSVPLQHHI